MQAPDEAPDESAAPKQLTAADHAKIRRLLAAARRASKARQWRKANQLAGDVLKLQPDNPQPGRIKKIAASKIR